MKIDALVAVVSFNIGCGQPDAIGSQVEVGSTPIITSWGKNAEKTAYYGHGGDLRSGPIANGLIEEISFSEH